MQAAPYAALYLIPALIAAGLSALAWRRRRQRGALEFGLLMAAIAFWSGCHALSVSAPSLEGTLRWSQVQYAGIVAVGPLWLLMALAYTGRSAPLRPYARFALFLPALLAYAAVLTNDLHHLWWPSVAQDTGRAFMSLAVTHGPLFWAHAAYSYACVLAGLLLFVQMLAEAPAIYREQARQIVLGAMVPVVGNVAHLLGVRFPAVDDPTPFLFTASGIVLSYAVARYRLLDLEPIAQREIFESMPDGIVVLDTRGIVAAVNAQAPQILGIPPADWGGRPMAEMLAGSVIEGELLALIDGAQPAQRDIIYLEGDGIRGAEVRLRPLRVAGRRAGSVLVVRDISDRVAVEQALEGRLAELTLISRIARAANSVAQTEELLRIISGGLASTRPWSGVAIGLLESGGASLRLLVDPEGEAGDQADRRLPMAELLVLQEALQARQIRIFRTSDALRPDSIGPVLLRQLGVETLAMVPLYHQDAALGVLFVASRAERTVTPEELTLFSTLGEMVAEAIVRAQLYDQSQQLGELKMSFLANVSHELRTPLTSILGFVDMLQQGIFGTTPESIDEPVAMIRRSSELLLHMINNLLDFSKMEAGYFSVELEPVDLASLVHSVIGVFRPQFQERRLELRLALAPDLPAVLASPQHVEQVLNNLLSNALKFTDRGAITVFAAAQGDGVRLSVQDTGIGIAPEHQRRLFQAFEQIRGPHTRRNRGTGLGLVISKRLVEAMGGALTLESAPGVGSTFHCDLRAAASPEPWAAAVGGGAPLPWSKDVGEPGSPTPSALG